MQLNQLNSVCDALKANKVVALPTDTVYGLSTLVNPIAIQNLIDLKKRPKDKGFIVISTHPQHLLKFIDTTQLSREQLDQLCTPTQRPTTWVVPVKDDFKWLTGAFQSIAVRLCQHPAIEKVTTALDQAITSSSANLSGQPPIKYSTEIEQVFGDQLGAVFHHEITLDQPPSRLIELASGKILRA